MSKMPSFSNVIVLSSIFLSLLGGETVTGALMEVKAPLQKCQESDLQECSATAESLIKDPGLFFPDKSSTLNRVCGMWQQLTSCIDNYTTKCYTQPEKVKFDRLFKESIMAVTIVCTDQSYRNDYLKYAPCVRQVTTEAEHCGFSYQILIDQISNSAVTMKQLCCTRMKFKSCILSKTKEVCDQAEGNTPKGEKVPIGSAKPMNITRFAQQVVDKSLAFIAQRCANIKTGKEDCEIGTPIIVRPNSKGPLLTTDEDHFQSDASNPPPQSVHTHEPTKFQTGQKIDGTALSPNSITSVEKKPVEFNLPNLSDTKRGFSQTLTGLIPKGTESKGTIDSTDIKNDRLKLQNGGTFAELAAAKESKENAAKICIASVSSFMLASLLYFIVN